MLTIKCSCGEMITASEEHIGKKVRCRCGCIIDIVDPLPQPTTTKQKSYSQKTGVSNTYVNPRDDQNKKRSQPKSSPYIPLWCILAAFVVFSFNRWHAYEANRDRQEQTQALLDQSTKKYDEMKKSLNQINDPKPIPLLDNVKPVSRKLHNDIKSIKYNDIKPIEYIPPVRPAVSLPNGEDMTCIGSFDGHCKLTIDNGNTRDAAVKLLSQDGSIERFFYVRAKHQVTIEHIPNGNYDVYFASGTDWDVQSIDFRRDNTYTKFEKIIELNETNTEEGVYYDVCTLTLHKSPLGNAHSRSISKEEFEHASSKFTK